MPILPKVFFDANAGTHEHGYWLHLPTSEVDLAKIVNGPREGMRVTIYMPDEFETDAILGRDGEADIWIAIPIPNTIRYLDGS